MTIQGIDVSKWNGDIDWSLVAAFGIKFAMIRIGYGAQKGGFTKDPTFEANIISANLVGISTGVYLYSYARSPEAAAIEAEKMIQVLDKYRTLVTYPVVYDIEEKNQAALGKSVCTAMCNAFCDRVRAAGYKPMVYANNGWLTGYLYADQLRADVWLALWRNTDTYKGTHTMWQYSASGSVAGIAGDVDMDFSYVDYAEKPKEKEEPAEWAKEAFEWAKKNGIIFGDGEGHYGLSESCSVERLLVFLNRLYKLMNEDDGK